MKNLSWADVVYYLIVISLVAGICFLASCKSQKVNWAKECAERYPIKIDTLYKEGKTVIDTTYVPVAITDTFECPPADTAIKYQIKIQTKFREVVKTKVDTIIQVKENTAKSEQWQGAYAEEVERRLSTEKEVKKWEAKAKKRGKKNLHLVLVIITLSAWVTRKLWMPTVAKVPGLFMRLIGKI